jgi:salicylate synthetase
MAAALVGDGTLHGDFFLYCGGDQVRLAGDWLAVVTVSADAVTLEHDGRVTSEPVRDPLAQAGRLLASLPKVRWTAYGFFAFDLARFYLPYPVAYEGPLLRLGIPRLEVVLKGERMQVRSAADPDRVAALLAGAGPGEPIAGAKAVPVGPGDRDAFCRSVEELRDAIHAGKLEKAILSRRHRARGHVDLLETYAAAARVNRSPRSFCFRSGPVAAVGFSPEILLKCDARGRVLTNPLAGTRPRGATPDEDERLRTELGRDPKEIKEHVVSVLLAEQELRTVCRPRTVHVRRFMEVKKFHCVQHLSSHVAGRLQPGRAAWDAVRAVFPAVTVSGVPKAAALEWIGALEGRPRGLYGGAVGWIDDRGSLDLALAIRTVFQYGDSFELAAGAGILAESQPEREYAESVMKMNTMAGQIVLSNGPASAGL